MTKEQFLQRIKQAIEKNQTELYFIFENLTELPSEIAQLTNLQTLLLEGNQLSELPPEITQLTNLQVLSLNGNQLSELPPEITQLTNLERLSLDRNQLSELPPEITQLTNLQMLDLDRNQLSELPPEITQLTNLQVLSLNGNQLSELPPEITQLTNLQTLSLDGEQLKSFQIDLIKLKGTTLIINGTPISAELLERVSTGQELLDNYSILRGERRELNEAKVLVVGQGSVGKTSLIKRLITGGYNPAENKTDGIDIYKEWKVSVNDRQVQLNVWDFGGQEIMHATHQFFLTKRSLYVLVLDSRLDKDENRVDYWLEKIKSLGGNSPVIVVGNKIDQKSFDINQKGLLKKYPNIKGFYPVSCATQKNLLKLKDDLIAEIGNLSGINDILPLSWFKVKESLEEIDKDYIPFEKYEEVCDQQGVQAENHGKLVRLLHDLGIILNFRDDDRLSDTNVLNPEWVTQGVYKILNSKELFKTEGVLRRNFISNILDTRIYPKYKQLFIIDMMRKFELCFDIEIDQIFLVPDLLEENELDTGDWSDCLKFQYHYNVFFNSIITRFIVKMHKNISQETYWRTGVVLVNKDGEEILNRALVKADTAERKIFISIDGNKNTRREFLSQIRANFDEIHNTFTRQYVEDNISQKVPIPTNPEIVVDYWHLRQLEDAGKQFVTPEGMVEEFSVKALLNGIESEEEREETKNKIQIKPIYSPEYQELLKRKNDLEPTKANLDGNVKKNWFFIKFGLIIPILVGLYYLTILIWENWDKINKNLQSAHILIVVLVGFLIWLIYFLFGGKENFKNVVKRVDELREETMQNLSYKWNGFEIDEYKEICKLMEEKKNLKELVED